jgi:hypothetical protein
MTTEIQYTLQLTKPPQRVPPEPMNLCHTAITWNDS